MFPSLVWQKLLFHSLTLHTRVQSRTRTLLLPPTPYMQHNALQRMWALEWNLGLIHYSSTLLIQQMFIEYLPGQAVYRGFPREQKKLKL